MLKVYSIIYCLYYSATSQWFANVGDIKTQALEALQGVQFHPESCELIFTVWKVPSKQNAYVQRS